MKKGKWFTVLLLLTVLFLPVLPVKGRADDRVEKVLDSGVYQGIRWEIRSVPSPVWEGYDWVLVISGNGAIPDFDNPNSGCTGDVLPPWMRCRWTYYQEYAEAGMEPDSYQKNPYFENVGSFYGAYLTEIIIQPGITAIGKNAFCPATVQCSYGSSTIEEVVIPDTVTRIGEGAFSGWTYVNRAVVPDSVKELEGGYLFKPATTIVCSSTSAAYRYAKKVDCPVELTDLTLSLTVNGKSGSVSLKKGDKVSYRVTSSMTGITPTVTVSDSSLLQVDTAAQTVTVTGEDGTGTLTASAQGKRVSVEIRVKRRYAITYILDGGKNNSKNPASYTEGSAVKLKSPVKKGCKFEGWYNSFYGGTKISRVENQSITLYARWKKVTVPQVKKLKVTNQKTKKAVITFGKVQYAKGYQVQYATKSSFKSGTTKSKTVKTNKLTISSGLRKNGTYHVRVRAYKLDSKNCKVYGLWSDPVKVKIKK